MILHQNKQFFQIGIVIDRHRINGSLWVDKTGVVIQQGQRECPIHIKNCGHICGDNHHYLEPTYLKCEVCRVYEEHDSFSGSYIHPNCNVCKSFFSNPPHTSALKQRFINPGVRPKIEGKRFVVTGTLVQFTRNEFEASITKAKGIFSNSISSKVDYLVIGNKPGGTKLTKAQQLGIKTIEEDEFLRMWGGNDQLSQTLLNSLRK